VGKASSYKKVARAARTGGGRTARGRRPLGWYTALGVFVALGIGLIVFSRNQNIASATVHPRGRDHWHAAYAIYICGQKWPDIPQPAQLIGIHTHSDGLIHVEPYASGLAADAGRHATLARFVEGIPGFKLTSHELQYPGQPKVWKNGEKCPSGTADAGKAGQVTIRLWPRADGKEFESFTNPKDLLLKDGQAITIAFAVPGEDVKKPDSIPRLASAGSAPETQPGHPAAPLPSVPPATVPVSPATGAPGTTTPASAPPESTTTPTSSP